MAAGYIVETTADVDLTAATAKTILSVINASGGLIRVTGFSVTFDGIVASAEPVTVELCGSTQATAGTSTAFTPVQTRGAPRTVQATAARNFTAEPTAITRWYPFLVHPQAGIVIQFPLGREPEMTTTADAILLRVTSPGGVENCQGWIEFEEG